MAPWPKLPARAAYLRLDNPHRRNALSLAVLRSLRDQLLEYNTTPRGDLRILPPFDAGLVEKLEAPLRDKELAWLRDADAWESERSKLPKVLLLRSEGPVFCSGHDLAELKSSRPGQIKETFALCAEVMALIRRSPVPVVGRIEGLATAAGFQLAMTTDIPIARRSTTFRLPGAALGLPCTSPSTAVSRRLGGAYTYRLLALAEPVSAGLLPAGAVDLASEDTEAALDNRVMSVVSRLAAGPGQPQALGKWAFWTQHGIRGAAGAGGDGYEEALKWTGRVMGLHAQAQDAKEGMSAFFAKEEPKWKT